MRSISNGKDRQLTVGIDIGSSNIRCAIGSIIPDANRVKLLGISSTPSMGFRKGSISHRNQLIEQLEKVLFEAETMADVKVNNAVLAITGNHIRCLNTQAAAALNRNRSNGVSGDRAIVETDIDQVLNLSQAISLPPDRDILHTLPQEYSVDTLKEINNPIGLTGRRLEGRVHLVTAATSAMRNIVDCVEEIGIKVNGLVFQPLASAIATLKHDEMQLGVTLAEIGSSTTDIAVYHGGAVRHSAVIPIGSGSITNDIAVMLQISIEEAESIKIKYASAKASLSSPKLEFDLQTENGDGKRSISEHELSRYVEARMQEIFHLIINEISRADIKESLTYGLVLSGGGAQLSNISALAEDLMGMRVRIGTPKHIDGITDIADLPIHSTTMGLLLWPILSNDFAQSNHISMNTFFQKLIQSFKELF